MRLKWNEVQNFRLYAIKSDFFFVRGCKCFSEISKWISQQNKLKDGLFVGVNFFFVICVLFWLNYDGPTTIQSTKHWLRQKCAFEHHNLYLPKPMGTNGGSNYLISFREMAIKIANKWLPNGLCSIHSTNHNSDAQTHTHT